MTWADRAANIAEAQAIAERHGDQAAVVIRVGRDGRVTISSFAETRRKCRAIGVWAQSLHERGLSAAPFRTHFGTGTGGVPTPFTADELATLTPAGLALYEAMGQTP